MKWHLLIVTVIINYALFQTIITYNIMLVIASSSTRHAHNKINIRCCKLKHLNNIVSYQHLIYIMGPYYFTTNKV